MTINGGVSHWYAEIGLPTYRARLAANLDADVCIVGGGLTGLWTAYYLKRAAPDLAVVVLEREFAGFGASGRNGGWLSDEIGGSLERYAHGSSRAAVLSLIAQMRETVDEVISVARAEGIDADIVKEGMLTVARNRAQLQRLHKTVAHERSWGSGEADLRVLDAADLDAWTHVSQARAGVFSPHCARVQPAKLVQGLAGTVERLGVPIYEQTAVREIAPHTARTAGGHTVRAKYVLRCLEGFTSSVKGHRRDWLPMNSTIVVTDPIPSAVRERINWHGATLLGDFAHAYIYAQLTADGRIAFGGRGIPYRFGSATDRNGETQPSAIGALRSLLDEFFPDLRDVGISHAWSGVLGVPRDWCATVDVDHSTGLGVAGGYVGNGLSTTNLAARTLADLVLKQDTERTRLPWVGRTVRRWEPEPLRWLGVTGLYVLYRAADRREFGRDLVTTSRLARFANYVAGR